MAETIQFLQQANGHGESLNQHNIQYDPQTESYSDYRRKIARHKYRPAAIPLSLVAGSGLMNAASVEYALENLVSCYEEAWGIHGSSRTKTIEAAVTVAANSTGINIDSETQSTTGTVEVVDSTTGMPVVTVQTVDSEPSPAPTGP